ncbi:MAG: glycosyltransferase family 4 protein [Candidatus Woesearchaeota archaeon]
MSKKTLAMQKDGNPPGIKTILLISPNFYEPTAWMMSAYKSALALTTYQHLKVVVLTSQTKGSKAYERIQGVEVYRSKGWYLADPFNYTFTPFIFRDLGKLIKKYQPDAFLISKYMFFTSLTGFYLRLKGYSYVLQTDTFPGYIWFSRSTLLNVLMWVYTRTLGLLLLRMAKKVVLLHRGLLAPAKELGLAATVIPNGVDLQAFAKAKPASDLLALAGKDKDSDSSTTSFTKSSSRRRFLVTYVGRLDAVKGYDILLRAAQILHEQKLPVQFVFVCGDKYPEKRKALAQAYPFIRFFGFRSDIPSVFKASDIHVLASTAEGLPNSVLEAMACHCVVIATPVGALPYHFKNKKDILFVKQDPHAFAKAIAYFVEHPEMLTTYQQNAYATITTFFDWAHLSSSLAAVLGESRA